MLQAFEPDRAQHCNPGCEPAKVAAHNMLVRGSPASDTAPTRRNDVPYHPRWALMQIAINLVLWAVIIAGAMLIVPRL